MFGRKKKQKDEYEGKIKKITDRLEHERLERQRATAFARMMPSNLKSGKLNVKINVRINDKSFYCRQVKLWYSAGADEFREIMMDMVDDLNFAVVLGNIPLDTTVLYYLELLDRGGVWLKQLRNEEKQQTFEFSTNIDGINEVSDWDESELIKCVVCGYMCRREWDECPDCKTPLYTDSQEIFADDQKKKEVMRAKEIDPDEIAWREAQKTDESWRGLAECPSCGYSVQEGWSKCPVCNMDFTDVKLKKKAVYDDLEEEMDAIEGKKHKTYVDDTGLKSAKDTKKEMEEIKKRKAKNKEDEWNTDTEDRDIL
ncbi:MAG: hypothetical protein GY870_09930 [archaeon]|nr:hypothetical protein [archaeon]